jgi:two-component system OmpR family sensor kinase
VRRSARDGRTDAAPGRAAADALLVRSAALTVAAQTAAAVAAVLVLVGLVAAFLTLRDQHRATERTVRAAAQSADDVADPPLGVVLLRVRPNGPTVSSRAAPAGFATLDAAALPPGLVERRIGPATFELYTDVRENGVRYTAALDLRQRHEDSARLLGALAVAGGIGVVGAAVVGGLVGRRAVRPLAAALTLQRRFVTDASHELRTPLTVVHTRAQLLRRRLGDGDPSVVAETEQLVADTRALGEVVQDLLLSAELGARPSAGTEVDVGELVMDVVRSLRPYAAQHGLSLTSDVADGGLCVTGTVSALRRALAALTDNAFGHTAPGGSVVVRARREGGEVAVTVADDGEGLDPADVHLLLSRFARGAEAGGNGRRFGLGLALVQEVVAAHGGALQIQGAPGVGAEVTLRLPARASGPATTTP